MVNAPPRVAARPAAVAGAATKAMVTGARGRRGRTRGRVVERRWRRCGGPSKAEGVREEGQQPCAGRYLPGGRRGARRLHCARSGCGRQGDCGHAPPRRSAAVGELSPTGRPHWEAASGWDSKWNGPAGRPPTRRRDLGSVPPVDRRRGEPILFGRPPKATKGSSADGRRLVPHDGVRPRRRAASSRPHPPASARRRAGKWRPPESAPCPFAFASEGLLRGHQCVLVPPARPVSPLAWDAHPVVAGSSGTWLSAFFLLLFGVQRDKGDRATLWLSVPFHLEYAPAVWAGARQVAKQSAHPQRQREPVCGRHNESCPTAACTPSRLVEGASDKPRGVRYSLTAHAKLTLRQTARHGQFRPWRPQAASFSPPSLLRPVFSFTASVTRRTSRAEGSLRVTMLSVSS